MYSKSERSGNGYIANGVIFHAPKKVIAPQLLNPYPNDWVKKSFNVYYYYIY